VLNQPEVEHDHKNIVEQGFTLVELLIVIVIMGILAGIVVFAVGNLTQNAGQNACKVEADTYATAFQAAKAKALTIPSGVGVNTETIAEFLRTNSLLSFDTGNPMKYLDATDGGKAGTTGWTADHVTGSVVTTGCS
jgi:prepilin-type N-terminal cleavage/methylation domain-containing protein